MNLTSNGKIGRLSSAIREQLNRRLPNGENGRILVDWLNSMPEVQAVLSVEFQDKPIRKQNLSEWRNKGFSKWLRQQEALKMSHQLAGDFARLQPPGDPPLADQIAIWLTAHYILHVQNIAEKNPDGELNLKVWHKYSQDLAAIRRGDHSAARLNMEQQRLERVREKAGMAASQNNYCPANLTPEEQRRRIREIYGLLPEPPREKVATDGLEDPLKDDAAAKPDQTESKQINPNENIPVST